MEYQVTWTLEVDADTPLEAAQQARSCQSSGTDALFFEVFDNEGNEYLYELTE